MWLYRNVALHCTALQTTFRHFDLFSIGLLCAMNLWIAKIEKMKMLFSQFNAQMKSFCSGSWGRKLKIPSIVKGLIRAVFAQQARVVYGLCLPAVDSIRKDIVWELHFVQFPVKQRNSSHNIFFHSLFLRQKTHVEFSFGEFETLESN